MNEYVCAVCRKTQEKSDCSCGKPAYCQTCGQPIVQAWQHVAAVAVIALFVGIAFYVGQWHGANDEQHKAMKARVGRWEDDYRHGEIFIYSKD